MNLYFIALIPPDEIREEVKSLKEEMSARFRSSHALKSPAHITLQMPFKRDDSFEEEMYSTLHSFTLEQLPIER